MNWQPWYARVRQRIFERTNEYRQMFCTWSWRAALSQCERKFARVLMDNIFGNMQKEILSELLAVGKIILRQDLPIGVYFGCNFTLDYNPQQCRNNLYVYSGPVWH